MTDISNKVQNRSVQEPPIAQASNALDQKTLHRFVDKADLQEAFKDFLKRPNGQAPDALARILPSKFAAIDQSYVLKNIRITGRNGQSAIDLLERQVEINARYLRSQKATGVENRKSKFPNTKTGYNECKVSLPKRILPENLDSAERQFLQAIKYYIRPQPPITMTFAEEGLRHPNTPLSKFFHPLEIQPSTNVPLVEAKRLSISYDQQLVLKGRRHIGVASETSKISSATAARKPTPLVVGRSPIDNILARAHVPLRKDFDTWSLADTSKIIDHGYNYKKVTAAGISGLFLMQAIYNRLNAKTAEEKSAANYNVAISSLFFYPYAYDGALKAGSAASAINTGSTRKLPLLLNIAARDSPAVSNFVSKLSVPIMLATSGYSIVQVSRAAGKKQSKVLGWDRDVSHQGGAMLGGISASLYAGAKFSKAFGGAKSPGLILAGTVIGLGTYFGGSLGGGLLADRIYDRGETYQ